MIIVIVQREASFPNENKSEMYLIMLKISFKHGPQFLIAVGMVKSVRMMQQFQIVLWFPGQSTTNGAVNL